MNKQKIRRQSRIRKHIRAVSDRPRLSVHRSNKYIYAQIIDDEKGVTLLGVSDRGLKGTSVEKAKTLGEKIAKLATEKNIKSVVFDKGRYSYHGRVKAIAEGVREGGINV